VSSQHTASRRRVEPDHPGHRPMLREAGRHVGDRARDLSLLYPDTR
jgi:hypothetical protein